MLVTILCQILALATASAPRDVQSVVRAVEARYQSATTLKATFLERYKESGRDVRIESGTVYFSRPGRMRWEYESPEEKLFIADGKTVWFYVPADRTVTRAPMKQSTDWRTPLALLAGKAKFSRVCSRLELSNEQAHAPGHVVLRCIPRGEGEHSRSVAPPARTHSLEAGNSFHEALLEVDAERGELARVVVREEGGIEMEYRFAAWQENLAIPEAMFHFYPPAGVAIVDGGSLSPPPR